METQVIDAEKRAFAANQQVRLKQIVPFSVRGESLVSSYVGYVGRSQVKWMEAKLKASDGRLGDSEMRLFQQCQQLQASVQEKEEVIAQLEQQLEEQSCIDDRGVLWKPGEAQRLSSLTFGCFQVMSKNPQVLTGPAPSQRTLSTQEERITLRDTSGKSSHRGKLLGSGETEMPCFAFQHCFLFVLAERSIKNTPSSDTGGDVHRQNQSGPVISSWEETSTPKNSPENVCRPESPGNSCLLSSAALEEEGVCEGKGGVSGFSRPCSENYLTASDDSSSLFDDDMQRAERPIFSLVELTDAALPGALGGGKEESKAKLEDCTSEELNQRFQSQRLDSSSSSSEPTTPSPILTPALTPKRPNAPRDPMDNPASPKQPRLRTPTGCGLLNVSLVKKHLSQPLIGSEAAHGQTRNALSMLRPLRPQETDLDQHLEDGMETGRDTPHQIPPSSPMSHTWGVFPSDPSLQASYPAFVMYTLLIYKNMTPPVYTTLKGVSSAGLLLCMSNSRADTNQQDSSAESHSAEQESILRRVLQL
ncbi:hypothetical protein GOODEAATRI_000643 [Goodea atripinnis]|uniref:Uncharacterized protein n=1 Tax=Goodea atripinnis TaxID=208336 RepID=A0ABV0MR71_9TELE